MDSDELLDYALGQLDQPRREELEKLIRRDPELTERVNRLIRNLRRLLDDGQAPYYRWKPSSVRLPRATPRATLAEAELEVHSLVLGEDDWVVQTKVRR